MAKVAVVILNFNGVGFLRKFLPYVVQHSEEADIIVADNGSTDESLQYLQSHYLEIEILVLGENRGYANGYNIALKQLNHEYFVLLNSDIKVMPNWINPVIQFMDKHPKVAACQPKILDFYNPSYFEYAGAAGGFLDALGYPYCRGRVLDQVEKDNGQYDENLEIFWATGACMFIRNVDFQKVGGFDAVFFAHMEEIDLCWRLHHFSKQVYCIPSSTVYHVGGGTLHKMNAHKTYLNFRNNLSLLLKNETWTRLLWIMPMRLMLDWIASLRFWKEYSFAHFRAVIKAQKDFIKLVPINIQKRNRIIRKNTLPVRPRIFLLFRYYFKKQQLFKNLHQK